jgi:hypothetical protein
MDCAKSGPIRAAEAVASEHGLMAIFGWDDASMARIYTRKAAPKKLVASGAAKLGLTNKIVPLPVPPKEKIIKNNAVEEGWCPEEDSNLHGFHHWYLKPARLPIPPSGPARTLKEGRVRLSTRSLKRQYLGSSARGFKRASVGCEAARDVAAAASRTREWGLRSGARRRPG